MPHDKHGKELTAGDTVTITATVTGVSSGENHCNLTVETVEGMLPSNAKTTITLNAHQVEKVDLFDLEDDGLNEG